MKCILCLSVCNVLPMVWRVTNESVDCRPSRGTNKHAQDRKRCSLLDDDSTATLFRTVTYVNYKITTTLCIFFLVEESFCREIFASKKLVEWEIRSADLRRA